jgi:hypothetical protein
MEVLPTAVRMSPWVSGGISLSMSSKGQGELGCSQGEKEFLGAC